MEQLEVISKNVMKPIFLTYEEMAIIEDALFARSSVLNTIANTIYTKEPTKAEQLESRVATLERLARKVGYPLDNRYDNPKGN